MARSTSDTPGSGRKRRPTLVRKRRRAWLVVAMKALVATVAALAVASVVSVAIYGFVNPPATPLMLLRALDGSAPSARRRWVPLARTSPHLLRAVIASEDMNFCRHWGFDLGALREVILEGRHGGGSTITQQTAKNVFLWPEKSYLRKGLEAGFAVLIEAFWTKRRILEVYVNSVEWGEGIYGAEAAARRHFRRSADRLTLRQSALLAVALPNPRQRIAGDPGPTLRRLAARIVKRARFVTVRDGVPCPVTKRKKGK